MFDYRPNLEAELLHFWILKDLMHESQQSIDPNKLREALITERWRFLIYWVERQGGKWKLEDSGNFTCWGFEYGDKEVKIIDDFLFLMFGGHFIPSTTPEIQAGK